VREIVSERDSECESESERARETCRERESDREIRFCDVLSRYKDEIRSFVFVLFVLERDRERESYLSFCFFPFLMGNYQHGIIGRLLSKPTASFDPSIGRLLVRSKVLPHFASLVLQFDV
jgi:hypothetical protein